MFILWNLTSKYFIFVPDWSIINWKHTPWVQSGLLKDDSIFHNDCFCSLLFTPTSASTESQNIFSASTFGNNEDLNIWEQKIGACFYCYHFHPRKNLNSFNSLNCHPLEFWLTVFLYFSETVLKLPFSKSFLICIFPN